jgi:hypothetical protein
LCPADLTISNEHLTRGFNNVYDHNLANSLKNIHKKHQLLWNGMQVRATHSLAAYEVPM